MTASTATARVASEGRGLEVRLSQAAPVPLDLAFTVGATEMLALVGPSGAGKTTVLRAIAGLLRPAAARVAVAGEIWADTERGLHLPPHRRRVGLVFQSYALFPHMSALGNVMAALGHLPAASREARARELLAQVHLGGLEERRPAALSGGQQQRVAVARALAREPRVLLLDEPFSAVDRATRQRLYREIAALRQRLDVPMLLVTHDIGEATALADRMAVVDHGRILQQGPPDEIATRPANARVARLMDIRNVFEGRIVGRDPARGVGVIDWRGRVLELSGPPPLPAGAAVGWVVPDGFVVLHRRDRPSRGEHENPVPGVIGEMLVIGQTAHLTLLPDHAPDQPLHFSVPLHVARRNAVAPGARATVSVLAEGVHLIPPAGRDRAPHG